MTEDSDSKLQAEFTKNVKTRQYIRQKVTRIFNEVIGDPDDLTISKVTLYIDKMTSAKYELSNLDKLIYTCKFDDAMTSEDDLNKRIEEDESY